MKNPMSNIIFGMAPALFQIGRFEGVISNAPAPSKAIEISLKPAKQAAAVDSLDINPA
jgi:hypothetical protein